MMEKVNIDFFEKNGYCQVSDFLTAAELQQFRALYDDFVEGRIDSEGHRSDLSGAETDILQEKIVQIMRPSLLLSGLEHSPMHQRSLAIARELLGADMAMDFDMMIDKPSFSSAATPWHQDEAYWINMPDKRAVSCWIALDDVTIENGCMWFVPCSQLEPLRPHVQTGKGGALCCEASETEGLPVEMRAGGCTFHHGRTVHYSRGNSTATRRRAFIINFRPEAMIEFERMQGFDHLGERAVRGNKNS